MDTRNHSTPFAGLVVDIEQFDVRIGERGWHTYQVIRHPGGVAVVPLHADGTVTLIRQLRPAIGMETLELPAGRRDPAEAPETCGLRELKEETGLTAGSVTSLGTLHTSPGVFDELIHLYLATDLTQGIAEPEAYEDIATIRLPLTEALAMLQNGQISDGKTIVGLVRAAGQVAS